jgi:hypothetical protein
MPRSIPVSVVSDPYLPAVEILLGPQAGPFPDAVLDGTGSRLRSYAVSQVRLVPSKSVTVQYRAKLVSSTGGPQVVTLVAASGVKTPDGVPVFAADGVEISFGQFPNDPFLPGLASAQSLSGHPGSGHRTVPGPGAEVGESNGASRASC